MELPKVAAKVPAKVEMEEGKRYAWCTCGLSENQPFCNGAHKGTEYRPNIIVCEEAKTAWLCQCKMTSHPEGYCDRSHKKL